MLMIYHFSSVDGLKMENKDFESQRVSVVDKLYCSK